MKTCQKCGFTKPNSDFSFRDRDKGTYHRFCKKCFSELRREAYQKNKEEIKKRTPEAQAKANQILSKSLTPELVEYEKARKWNGTLPQYTGSMSPMIQLH